MLTAQRAGLTASPYGSAIWHSRSCHTSRQAALLECWKEVDLFAFVRAFRGMTGPQLDEAVLSCRALWKRGFLVEAFLKLALRV